MKKITLAFLALCLLFSLCACSEDTAQGTTTAVPESTVLTEGDPAPTDPENTQPTAATTVPTEPEITEPEVTPPVASHRAVDIQLLDQLTAEDTFGVKIIKTEKMEGIFLIQGIYHAVGGDDGLVLTIQNNSGTKITKVTVLALATNQDRVPVTLDLAAITEITLGDENFAPEVTMMVCDVELENGGVYDQGAIQCSFDQVENINVFVYSYVDANGNEIINENCVQWLTSTMPD